MGRERFAVLCSMLLIVFQIVREPVSDTWENITPTVFLLLLINLSMLIHLKDATWSPLSIFIYDSWMPIRPYAC